MIQRWIDKNISDSLSGKLVAITGASGGIGSVICKYLVSLGASLILMDHSEEKSKTLKEKLLFKKEDARIEIVPIDLIDVTSTKKATEKMLSFEPDIFLFCSGVYKCNRFVSSLGYDNSYHINFVAANYMIKTCHAHFGSRGYGHISIVGSVAYKYSKLRETDEDLQNEKKASIVYGNAKRHLMGSVLGMGTSKVTYAISHPGVTYTAISSHYPKCISWLVMPIIKYLFPKPKKASLSILYSLITPCDDFKWIGPSVFSVFGYPKMQSYKLEEFELSLIKMRSNRAFLAFKEV